MKPTSQQYFVRWLGEHDMHAPPAAKFEVQVLNEIGEGEVIAYFAADLNKVIAIVHALRGQLPVEDSKIPEAVLLAAHRLVGSNGEYVNGNGEVVNPSFYPAE